MLLITFYVELIKLILTHLMLFMIDVMYAYTICALLILKLRQQSIFFSNKCNDCSRHGFYNAMQLATRSVSQPRKTCVADALFLCGSWASYNTIQ